MTPDKRESRALIAQMVLWIALSSLATFIMITLSGCVSVGHFNREIMEREALLTNCQETCADIMREADGCRQALRDKQQPQVIESQIEWKKKP